MYSCLVQGCECLCRHNLGLDLRCGERGAHSRGDPGANTGSRRWTRERIRRFFAVEDDTKLRLEYADEWERRGGEPSRARLIRFQVHLADLPGGVDHSDWLPLRSKVKELLSEHKSEWTPEDLFDGKYISRPVFHRGFIEQANLHVEALLNARQREPLFARTPIQHLNVFGVKHEEDLGLVLKKEGRAPGDLACSGFPPPAAVGSTTCSWP